MTDNPATAPIDGTKIDETKAKVSEAVARNEDIRTQVRDIVVEALEKKNFDPAAVKRTMNAVLQGAIEAAPKAQQEAAEVLKKTISGAEEALAKAAEASKLALEETRSRLGAFTEQDLKKATSDLKDIESLFVQSLKDFASASQTTISGVLHDAAGHAERTGTQISQAAKEGFEALQAQLAKVERPHLEDIEKVAREGSASFASALSGFFSGLADRLRPKPPAPGNEPPRKDG